MDKITVDGYEKFCETISNLDDGKRNIFVVFGGSKDEEGKSWCPDCVDAEPVIEKAIEDLPADTVIVFVSVGTRDEWRNPTSPFRKDSRLKLRSVPTLLHWGKQIRLEEKECQNTELLKMVLEEED